MPATYRSGHGAPSDAVGVSGDYYLDLDAQNLYLRGASAYAIVVNTGDPTLATNALTTIAHAQAWLRRNRITGNALTDDQAILTLAINGISSAIAKYTERQFYTETGGTKKFAYRGGGYLDFSPYELRTITSVALGADALTVSTGVGDGSYLPMPRNKTIEGTYTWIDMREYVHPYPTNSLYAKVLNERDVTIVGDWGMAAVPANVELACLIAVSDLYRNPEQGESRGSGDFQISELQSNPGSEESLPPGARRLLDPYVRLRAG